MTTPPRLMMDVYEEHLNEASFLWTQWERSLVAPDRNLAEVVGQEERLLAHLDGLVLGGQEVFEQLLAPVLEIGEQTELSSAALALLEENGAGVKRILERLVDGDESQRAGVQRALELSHVPQPGLLLPLLRATEPDVQASVLEVLVFRGVASVDTLMGFLSHETPRLRRAAVRGLSAHPGKASRDALRSALNADDPGTRLAAIETGLISGSRAAWVACRLLVEQRAAGFREALVPLSLGRGERELELLLELLQEPDLRPSVLWALGFSGNVSAAEACLLLMGEERRIAALAGEAFSAITGLRLEGAYVRNGDKEPEEPIPLKEEELDASLAPGPEDALKVPAPAAVEAWWREARPRFDRNTRYLMGNPFSAQLLLDALQNGPMRRRGVLALELAIRSRGQSQLQTRAFTQRQLLELSQARASSATLSTGRFETMLYD
ncbi:TIGR02270 family protein [Archangium lansingense]|uniref:TIGR02270 family protein n=1 Tax=Archangium lansingense TaxID=2995310 RepID=UPI003B81F30C